MACGAGCRCRPAKADTSIVRLYLRHARRHGIRLVLSLNFSLNCVGCHGGRTLQLANPKAQWIPLKGSVFRSRDWQALPGRYPTYPRWRICGKVVSRGAAVRANRQHTRENCQVPTFIWIQPRARCCIPKSGSQPRSQTDWARPNFRANGALRSMYACFACNGPVFDVLSVHVCTCTTYRSSSRVKYCSSPCRNGNAFDNPGGTQLSRPRTAVLP